MSIRNILKWQVKTMSWIWWLYLTSDFASVERISFPISRRYSAIDSHQWFSLTLSFIFFKQNNLLSQGTLSHCLSQFTAPRTELEKKIRGSFLLFCLQEIVVIVKLSAGHESPGSLHQELSKFFCKRPGGKYFRHCGPYGLHYNIWCCKMDGIIGNI